MATEKYKVLEDVTIDGAFYEAGSEVMLLDEIAAEFVGKVEKVVVGETPVGEKAEAPKAEEKPADESDDEDDEDSDDEEK